MNVNKFYQKFSTCSFFLFLLLSMGLTATAQEPKDSSLAFTAPPASIPEPPPPPPALARAPDTTHVYRISYPRSLGFTAIATAANLWATPNLIKKKKPLTDAELASLNPNIFNDMEKWALRQNVTDRDKINVRSDHVLTITSLSAAALLADRKIRKDWTRIVTLYLETTSFTFSVYSFSPFGPLFHNKVRPVSYYADQPMEIRKEGNSRNSLYSGHVANAAASTFFMVKVYSDYHPELGAKKYLLYGAASLPPLLIGYLRVKALYHFPSDCLIGLIIGGVSGIVVPETHRIRNHSNLKVGLAATAAGPGLALSWKFDKKPQKILLNYADLASRK
ncbi:phosphatase PAP2 family protein [Paraflavisolibacter sp. H34]|uniref:phosphatase PAP2 family protein n=1 Tax=Huijunlia imazamoxiresistens TaxID=3127457 RepID=UPI0030159BE1